MHKLIYTYNMKRNQTRINELKKINNIKTDTELSEKIGITPQFLHAKLNGNITMKTLEKLMGIFNVTYREMFKEDAKLEK